MVVNRDRKNAFGQSLPDDIFVETRANFLRRRQIGFGRFSALVARRFLANDVIAQLYAFIADEHGRAGDELLYLVLALAAKGAIQKLLTAGFFSHLT